MNAGEVILGIFAILMASIVTIVIFAPKEIYQDDEKKDKKKK